MFKKVCSGEQWDQNKYFCETTHMIGHRCFQKTFISLGIFFVENSKEFFSSHHHITSLVYASELAQVLVDCLFLTQKFSRLD